MSASRFRKIDPFLKRPITVCYEQLPQEMRSLVDEMMTMADQEEVIRYAYNALVQKYRGYRLLTFLRVDRFFVTDVETLWRKQGFLHCHQLNYFLRTLLIASGTFSSVDIEARWTNIWFCSPHQYLVVHLRSGEVLYVDVWSYAYGIPFGAYAHGFQGGSPFAVKKPS
jgi:hypothetical protein